MKEEEERTPLRTILQNFLNHIEKLDRENLEGSYDKEFQELKLFSEFLKTSKQYSCSQGEKEVNRKKNRYKDILPFDCSRVILEDYAGIPGSDYINANYIKGASGSPAYIASQGPLPHTVNDFWRMVVQCEVQVIVMACNEEESGKHKCENYWVEHEGEEKQFGMVAIQLIKASVVCPDFLVRTMRLKYTKNHSATQEERTVCQFHYSAWPDHGVPPLVRPLLDMVRLVRDTQASETLPVLVHCSAGCGRTGTICAIDYVWGLLRAGKLTKDFSLFKLVREMRKQRIAMVQTKEQYVLVHHAVKELFNEQLRMIDSHPYENIDVNGMVKESPEPVYATITFDLNNEEKQDSNEKECASQESDDAPPLPCKRKPYTAHTKQEKEVENLTEKHRSSFNEQIPTSSCFSPGTSSSTCSTTSSSTSSSSSSTCSSLLHKPRIAKLRALFERTSSRDCKSVQVKHRTPQQVTRSHSLGAVRKMEEGVICIQPIPNRGVLRVPREGERGRPVLPIKRSRSLKVLSSGERNKFSVPVTQGDASQESQYSSNMKAEVVELNSTPKVSSPNSKPLVSEVKPYVPPKKVIRDRFSDRKVVKNIADADKGCSPQSITHTSERSEDTRLVNSQMSVSGRWRRSLDSLTLEADDTIHQTLSTSAKVVPAVNKTEQYMDDEARKLLQDCRDFLTASAKCESGKMLSNPERTFKDSIMNFDLSVQRHLTVEAQRKVNAVVGGLGTRERRNSFRQAISREQESGAKPPNHEMHQVNQSVCNHLDGSKSIIKNPNVNGKSFIGASHLKMKVLPKPSVQTSPSYLPGQMLAPTARSYRAKPRGVQKIELPSGPQHVASTNTVSSKPSGQLEAPASHGEHPAAELRWASRPGCAPFCAIDNGSVNASVSASASANANANASANAPVNVQVHENVSVKGKLEKSVGTPKDLRLLAQISSHFQNKSGIAGHSWVAGIHNNGQSNVKMASSSSAVNQEMSDYKNVKTMTKRVNSVTKARFVSSGGMNTKPLEIPNSNGIETSVSNRGSFPEVSWIPQNVNHQTSHPSTVNERISINHEILNGIRKSRPAESQIIPSKIHSKGEIDLSASVKHEMRSSSSGCKEGPEKSVGVGTNQIKHSEWVGQLVPGSSHPRPVGKQTWTPTSVVHSQEHRFPNRGDSEQCSVTNRGTSNIESEPFQGADATNGERNFATGRVASKLTVKQKKEIKSFEGCVPIHHGSQDDLALCAAGSAGSSRVRRHASVVFLRPSLVDNNDSVPLAPLTVWNNPELGENSADTSCRQTVKRQDLEAWNVAPGVDVDKVGASIKPSRDHGTALTRALEAFHLRKPSRGAAVSPPQQRKFPQAQQVFVKKQHYL